MNYTTIEQSKRLLNLGLNPETADMFYKQTISGKTDMPYYDLVVGHSFAAEHNLFSFRNGLEIPCWSVGALWDINNICGIGPNNFGNKDVSSEHLFNTLYRWICIELIEDSDGLNSILIEEGYIKKGAEDE